MNWKELTVRYLKDLVKTKSIRDVILKEMREAQLRKLDAESAVEYAVSCPVQRKTHQTIRGTIAAP
jgi:hypothetical protein